jgi:hypothetical protein
MERLEGGVEMAVQAAQVLEEEMDMLVLLVRRPSN